MGAASRDFNCVAVQMPEKNFEYTEKESGVLGKVLRPLIEVEIKGDASEWIRIENALADTGAVKNSSYRWQFPIQMMSLQF